MGRGKAAQTASSTVTKTLPLASWTASASRAWCRLSARRYGSGWALSSWVLPSMSVKRKVMVPVGKSDMAEGSVPDDGGAVK